MPLWKVSGDKATPVIETSFKKQKILESRVEEWVAANPDLLGEPLLVIGRQVVIHEINDRIDLLALDRQGKVVVIEIKREDITAPVDIQGLRYASYVSGWKKDDLQRVAAEYIGEDDDDFELEAKFAEFAESEGTDEETPLNEDQRIVIVGQRVKNRLGSVALWLREKGVDIKLIELHPFLDGDEMYIEPIVIIPPPSTEKWERVGGRPKDDQKPWLTDGPAWHRKRAGDLSFERTEALIARLRKAKLANTVSYAQKHYVAVRERGNIWLYVRPRPNMIRLETRQATPDLDLEDLAQRLDLVLLEAGMELKDKFALPSSITTYERKGRRWLILRLKHDYKLDSEELLDFFNAVAHGTLT